MILNRVGIAEHSLRLLIIILATALVGPGCLPMAAGPHSSMAPFVQVAPQPDEKGKVSSATSVAFLEGDLYGPYGAGALSLWLSDRYDLALTSTSMAFGAEGNLRFWEGSQGFQLGLLHGIGGNFFASRWGDFNMTAITTAGLFAQTSSLAPAVYYGGVRGVAVFMGTDREDAFVDLSLGRMSRRGALQYGPELTLNLLPLNLGLPVFSLSFRLEGAF